MNHNVHHLPRLGLAAAMRLFGLTARALRFYEEQGLIEARRDRLNTRYYDPVARERLGWIARLRQANVGLADIRAVLDEADPEARRKAAVRKLTARREALARELGAADAALAEFQTPSPARRQTV